MASNTVWRIEWGNYSFALDRKTLTYDLTETQTGTVWASSLSVGWIELEDRVTGERARHEFSDAKVVSITEKASSQGKRLLIGLDLLGIPVDLYFICSEREIQLTVEASRDTRQFLVQDVGLLPGLVSVAYESASYLVIPQDGGAIASARDLGKKSRHRIWDSFHGATMPFVGAVRAGKSDSSAALALITDSAYGCFNYRSDEDAHLIADVEFERDPERRRLEIRIVPMPDANHVDVAMAYRKHLISQRAHITLRRKVRDRPSVEGLLGSVWISQVSENDPISIGELRNLNLHFGVNAFAVEGNTSIPDGPISVLFSSKPLDDTPSRWDDMADRLDKISGLQQRQAFVGGILGSDWTAISLDFWRLPMCHCQWNGLPSVPLYATVFHDSVVAIVPMRKTAASPRSVNRWEASFLMALLNLALPEFGYPWEIGVAKFHVISRITPILCQLHLLTFSSYLTKHLFLSSDFDVQEAWYSDGTSLTVNLDEFEAFERDDLHLPPLGFYVRHSQIEAHDALRVGDQTFATRAWRIRRSLDGKALEDSENILVQEFRVEPV